MKALLQADKEEREYKQKMAMGMNVGSKQDDKKENIQLNKPVPSDRLTLFIKYISKYNV